MPKDTTSGSSSVASGPRVSGRVTRIPSRFRHEDYTKPSYTLSLNFESHAKDEAVLRSESVPETDSTEVDSKDHIMVIPGLLKRHPLTGDYRMKAESPRVGLDASGGVRIKSEPADVGGALGVEVPELGSPFHGVTQEPVERRGSIEGQVAENADRVVLNEAEERFRLEHAIETIDSLNMRIHKLEKTEQHLKRQLKQEKERLKNSKADGEGALNLLVLAEEQVSEVETVMAVLKQEVDRYRRWWLTEYYSLKALLGMIPRENWGDARAIFESAEACFKSFSTTTD